MVEEKNVKHEEIGRKGGVSGTASTMERQGAGEKMKEGWNDFKAKVRQKWDKITDNDIDTYRGRSREDVGRFVHERVGGDRTQIDNEIDAMARDTNYRWQ